MATEKEQTDVIEKLIDTLEESNLSLAEKLGLLSVLQFTLLASRLGQ